MRKPEGRAGAMAVLVVEDESLIRADIVESLADAGLKVFEAAEAGRAIHLLETVPEIEVVFTDVDMPGSMDGLHLAAYIRDRWPPVSLIVTSGHVAVRDDQLPSGGRFFRKPYSAPEVMRAMAEMTSRPT